MTMLRQFLVGGLASVCNIAIHALVMMTVITVARAIGQNYKRTRPSILVVMMAATVSVLMAAHVVEVFVWALTYFVVGAVAPGNDLVYFAYVNYTTLGYGDVVPVKRWQFLGPMTAMNGVLLFGWSTAVIFEVLRKTLDR
jgi:ion channel